MGLLLYNKHQWGWGLSIQQLLFLNAMFPVVFIGPWVTSLRETTVVSGNIPVRQRLNEQVGRGVWNDVMRLVVVCGTMGCDWLMLVLI